MKGRKKETRKIIMYQKFDGIEKKPRQLKVNKWSWSDRVEAEKSEGIEWNEQTSSSKNNGEGLNWEKTSRSQTTRFTVQWKRIETNLVGFCLLFVSVARGAGPDQQQGSTEPRRFYPPHKPKVPFFFSTSHALNNWKRKPEEKKRSALEEER